MLAKDRATVVSRYYKVARSVTRHASTTKPGMQPGKSKSNVQRHRVSSTADS
jgi:hypothetical protein